MLLVRTPAGYVDGDASLLAHVRYVLLDAGCDDDAAPCPQLTSQALAREHGVDARAPDLLRHFFAGDDLPGDPPYTKVGPAR